MNRQYKPIYELFQKTPPTPARSRRDQVLITMLIRMHYLTRIIKILQGLLFDALAEEFFSYDRAKETVMLTDSIKLLTVLGIRAHELITAIVGLDPGEEVDSEETI